MTLLTNWSMKYQFETNFLLFCTILLKLHVPIKMILLRFSKNLTNNCTSYFVKIRGHQPRKGHFEDSSIDVITEAHWERIAFECLVQIGWLFVDLSVESTYPACHCPCIWFNLGMCPVRAWSAALILRSMQLQLKTFVCRVESSL